MKTLFFMLLAFSTSCLAYTLPEGILKEVYEDGKNWRNIGTWKRVCQVTIYTTKNCFVWDRWACPSENHGTLHNQICPHWVFKVQCKVFHTVAAYATLHNQILYSAKYFILLQPSTFTLLIKLLYILKETLTVWHQ